jgi:hypothetical protein
MPGGGSHGSALVARAVASSLANPPVRSTAFSRRAEVRAGHANFEMKWAGPDGVVIDISHTGWEGTH